MKELRLLFTFVLELEQNSDETDEHINVDIEERSSPESDFADYPSQVASMQLNIGNSRLNDIFPKHNLLNENQRLTSDLKSGFQTLKGTTFRLLKLEFNNFWVFFL